MLYLDGIVALVWTFPGWVLSPEVFRGAALLQTTIIIATIRIAARIIIVAKTCQPCQPAGANFPGWC